MGYEDPYLEMLTFSAMIEGYGILLVYLFPSESFPEETIKKYEDRMVEMFTQKNTMNAMKTRKIITGFSSPGFGILMLAQDPSPREIIRKADEKFNGEKTSTSHMSMTIVRPTWERTIEFKNWTSGRDFALTLITAPAREKGQSFLKRENEMWNWNPTISRLIKLPPSMMSQGWMGSDYTNDDILKESSVVNDYHHRF